MGWAAIAAICAFGLTYLLVQRPWRRRIESRTDALVPGAGEEVSHIPWDDIAAIRQAPLVSTARSGPARTLPANPGQARGSRRAGQGRGAENPVAGSEWNPRVNGESARTAAPLSTPMAGCAA
ncbi:hypothetical protein GCM10009570_10800 [Dietzia natronolimnaea]